MDYHNPAGFPCQITELFFAGITVGYADFLAAGNELDLVDYRIGINGKCVTAEIGRHAVDPVMKSFHFPCMLLWAEVIFITQ